LIGFENSNISPITMSIIGVNVQGQVRRMLGVKICFYDSIECSEFGVFLPCN